MSKPRKIIDSVLFDIYLFNIIFPVVVVLIIALFIGHCYRIINYSRDCNVVLEYVQDIETIFGDKIRAECVGSGVLISDDGWLVTAGHCLRDVNNLRVTLSNGESFDVTECYLPADANVDFGLIRLPVNVTKFRPLSDSNDVSGLVYNIGNSLGYWDSKFTIGQAYNPNFKRRALKDVKWILAWLPIQPGCSGGGVYKYDRLIGVASRKPTDYGCLIVPSNVISELKESCTVHKVGKIQKKK